MKKWVRAVKGRGADGIRPFPQRRSSSALRLEVERANTRMDLCRRQRRGVCVCVQLDVAAALLRGISDALGQWKKRTKIPLRKVGHL